MPPPTTYFDWSQLLERYARGDDAVLSELESGSFVVDSGTVYKFYNKVQEAYVERKKQWMDKFNRSFQVQSIRTESEMSIVLHNAKSNLWPIARMIRLSAFPKDLKDTLKKDFVGFVTDVRKNLRESVKKNQSGSERLLFIVNSFDFYENTFQSSFSDNSLPDSVQGTTPNKKRILF
jgi:hypothetical protein